MQQAISSHGAHNLVVLPGRLALPIPMQSIILFLISTLVTWQLPLQAIMKSMPSSTEKNIRIPLILKPVSRYQKSRLNDSEMELSARKSQKFEQNFQAYREGASGANGGKSGGGCGCN